MRAFYVGFAIASIAATSAVIAYKLRERNISAPVVQATSGVVAN